MVLVRELESEPTMTLLPGSRWSEDLGWPQLSMRPLGLVREAAGSPFRVTLFLVQQEASIYRNLFAFLPPAFAFAIF